MLAKFIVPTVKWHGLLASSLEAGVHSAYLDLCGRNLDHCGGDRLRFVERSVLTVLSLCEDARLYLLGVEDL